MIWNPKRSQRSSAKAAAKQAGHRATTSETRQRRRRTARAERLEPRRLLAADPIHLGLIYLETDYLESDQDIGSDSRGDRFILSFTGGAPGTELNEIRIDTDKDGDGISVGDPIYDTGSGGRGKGGVAGFELIQAVSADGAIIDAVAEVEDGGQELVLKLANFRASDRIEFTIDVDEVLRNASDLDVFNDRLDVITSGQEFQDSKLHATFQAPHYQAAEGTAVFVNDFGDPWSSAGLQLPADSGDDIDSRPNRSAAARIESNQIPEPVSLSGRVWADDNLDGILQSEETTLDGVQISLWKQGDDGSYFDTGLIAETDSEGKYEFPTSLDLMPGTYRVIQQQPQGYFSVAAIPGTIVSESGEGTRSGQVGEENSLTQIGIPLGGQQAIGFDFTEATPASISGYVYVDVNDNGQRDEDETPIPDSMIQIVSESSGGTVISTEVVTDSEGYYEIHNLPPGRYDVIQLEQPNLFLDGKDTVGRGASGADGSVQNPGDRIVGIELRGGDDAVDYNFGERPFASIGGFVYLAGPGGHCDPTDSAESPSALPGVTVHLQDPAGSIVATTVTDTDGRYQFDQVTPGQYALVQPTPDGLIDGREVIVDESGVHRSWDGEVDLSPGQMAVDHNFCELAPASVGGRVWQEPVIDGEFGESDSVLPGITLQLIGPGGNLIAETLSDDSGQYQFDDLVPGSYSIQQLHPADLFQGTQIVGEAGGSIAADDFIAEIKLGSGLHYGGYHFIDIAPATLSGTVFQDGETLRAIGQPSLVEIMKLRDGQRSSDDQPIAGVTIELRNLDGQPVDRADVLPAGADAGSLRAVTDAEGDYRFEGLPPGIYHIVQLQPAGFVDGIDTPGSSGGTAWNGTPPTAAGDVALLNRLRSMVPVDPAVDALLNIPLVGGQHSRDNNFSEVVVLPPIPTGPPLGPEVPDPVIPDPVVPPDGQEPEPQPPEPTQPETSPPPLLPQPIGSLAGGIGPLVSPEYEPATLTSPVRVASFRFEGPTPYEPYLFESGSVSWHLSVINGGYPRGIVGPDGVVRAAATQVDGNAWSATSRASGRWATHSGETPTTGMLLASTDLDVSLGQPGAIALAGDFDGDGRDEAVIYVGGQWFIDLNGNGIWDGGDLWVQLGTEMDRPVIGDWDGDGKDDVGIYGRSWYRDAMRIPREPGLPDLANRRRRSTIFQTASTRSATRYEATQDRTPRLLRRGQDGTLRADDVDHVFGYGREADIPLTGDWNGDGIDQIAIFRDGNWLLDVDGDGRWNDHDVEAVFGQPGDRPIVGDFNGDQIDEIGIIRGDWWIIDTDGDRRLTGNDLQIQVERHGEGSQPVVADWDGDGKDEPGYYNDR